MLSRRTQGAIALFMTLISPACSNDSVIPTEVAAPDVVGASAEATRHPLVEMVHVKLVRAAAVEVSYSTGDNTILTVEADSVSTDHDILLPRLLSGAAYTFTARARSVTGTLGNPVTGSFTTPQLPAALSSTSFTATGQATRPLTLVQISSSSSGWFGVVAVDDVGRIVWFHRTTTGAMGFLRRPNGEIAIIDKGIVVIGALGDTVAALPQTAGALYGNIHHALANSTTGGILFAATDVRTIADTAVSGDAVWEWNPATGSVVKRWTAFDFFDWSKERTPSGGAGDWLHANALSVGARGNTIMSFRNLNQVISIAPDWRSVEWRLGGPGSTLQLSDADAFYGQHGAREIAPDRVLLFDNGFDAPARNYSRALELAIDRSAHTAHSVWQYHPSEAVFSIRLGSVQRYSNGNTLIDFGWKDPFPIQVSEVTGDGQLVWSMIPSAVVSKIYGVEPVTTLFGETSR